MFSYVSLSYEVSALIGLFFFFFPLRSLLAEISQVSLADLIRVGQKYVAPLFDPAHSSLAVCCHPSKVDEIKEEFNR